MGHHRTAIRRYAVELLKNKVDVGRRVFPERPSPIFIQEVPCVLVYFVSEPVDIIVGDTYSPKEYQRNLRVSVDVWTNATIDPEDIEENPGVNDSQDAEDRVDYLAWQVERAFSDDWLFAQMLPGYDANNPQGLTMGMRLVSTDPYNVDVESETLAIAQSLQWEIPYETSAYVDKKYADFAEYQTDIMRVNWDENTVDPVLLSAEGKL